MKTIAEMKEALSAGSIDAELKHLYGSGRCAQQRARLLRILEEGENHFGNVPAMLVSAPGRTEIGGNHTDHQLGRVLAASIDLDVAAVVVPHDEPVVRYLSDAFTVQPVALSHLERDPGEANTTEALIRGVAAGLVHNGYAVGGFDAYAESDVLPGSGMSSSAAFEILIATIFNLLYNDGRLEPIEAAKIGQFAENVYFGKASGLMDQAACAVGGFAAMDFKDPQRPLVEKIDFDFDASGLALVLTDCRESHAELSDEYSKMPQEMRAAAAVLGKKVMSEVTMEEYLAKAGEVRQKAGDRAFLRGYHFLRETERALKEKEELRRGDLDGFLATIIDSGRSSFMYLQNVYAPGAAAHQSLAVGLALSEEMLREKGGAWRVHGGGFAGTIQAFVPRPLVQAYQKQMEAVFGPGCCYVLRIRDIGGTQIL
jgi:galactokinase